MRSRSQVSFRPLRAVLLAIVIASIAVSVGNFAVSSAGIALGAPRTQLQLQPQTFIGISVIVCIFGALGWLLVVLTARDPSRRLRWFVPVVFVVSFIPDVILALSTGPKVSALVTLAVMHLVTIAIAVAVFSRVMPARIRTKLVAANSLLRS